MTPNDLKWLQLSLYVSKKSTEAVWIHSKLFGVIQVMTLAVLFCRVLQNESVIVECTIVHTHLPLKLQHSILYYSGSWWWKWIFSTLHQAGDQAMGPPQRHLILENSCFLSRFPFHALQPVSLRLTEIYRVAAIAHTISFNKCRFIFFTVQITLRTK